MAPRKDPLPFGARAISDLRRSLGLNKTEFGAKIGVTRQTIATWEDGRHRPGLSARMLMDNLRRAGHRSK
jgi:DNA-binding transcriptional regulator YiaG